MPTIAARSIAVVLVLLGVALQGAAQTGPATVHLRDGGTVQGTIVEQVAGKGVSIQTAGADARVIPFDEIDWIHYDDRTTSAESRAGLESWYTYWALGGARLSYPDTQAPSVALLRDDPGIDHIAISMDLFGVYLPLRNQKTVVGGILNAAAERFQRPSGGSLQYNEYLFAASAIHFVNQSIGRGFFVRGDVGIARMVVVRDDAISGAAVDSGVGVLVGGGYAVPVSSGTRVMINASYARRHVGGEGYGAFSLSVGGLF